MILPKGVLILAIAVVTFLMGMFVVKQRRSPPNIAFFSLCTFAALESVFLLFREWRIGQNRIPLPWNNYLDASLVLFSLSTLFFAVHFPHTGKHSIRILLPFSLLGIPIAGFALAGNNFTGHKVIDHVHIVEPTAFYALYSAFMLGMSLLTVGVLLQKYRNPVIKETNKSARKALGTILAGFCAAITISFFFASVIPVLWNDTSYFYLHSLGFLIGTSVIFYSIVRYNAFDIETVIHKTLSWTFLSSVPVLAAVAGAFWLKPHLSDASDWLWAATVGGIGFFSGLYLYVAQPFVDQLFDRRKHDLRKTLDAIIGDLAILKDLTPMAGGILDRLCRVLPVEGARAWLFDPSQRTLRSVSSLGTDPRDTDCPEEVLEDLRAGNILNAAEPGSEAPGGTGRERIGEWLRDNSLALCIPLARREELIGAIGLARKRNLKSFSAREKEFLGRVKAAATIAFSNSLLLERIREYDRLKTEFLSDVAHELRGPLAGISDIAKNVLQNGNGLPEEHKRLIENAGVTASELKTLVEQLLDLSKIEMGVMAYEMRPVDVAAVVRLCVDLSRDSIRQKGLSLDLEIEDHLPPVHGDKTRIRQCISNLLSNAVKYTDHGRIGIQCKREENGVRIDVRDTGRGLTPEDRAGLFERYKRGGAAGGMEGSGLGLALTLEIVEAHRGRIEVQSESGRGSTFSLHLPSSSHGVHQPPASPLTRRPYFLHGNAQVPQNLNSEQSLASFKGKGETLVVIDDSEADREVLKAALSTNGYQVLTGKDGTEGLELVRSHKPSLVITDLVMPGLSGVELCRLLKEDPATASIPVILVTARNSLDDMIYGVQMGADDYVSKPYVMQLLLARIAAHLRMQRIRTELQEIHSRLNEMELIATSTGTLIHSIKNPLVVIRNYARLLEQALEKRKRSQIQKGLNRIEASAASISRILESLRRARINPPKLSHVHLPELLDACLRKMTEAESPSIVRIMRQYDEVKSIEGDRSQLEMAFANLLVNALEATPRGGMIILRTSVLGDETVQVEIEDSGGGIHDDVKNELFKPFFTTKSDGIGLGLWTAKRVIEVNHKGRLEVESAPGKGTIARVRLNTRLTAQAMAEEAVQYG